MAFDYDLFVIGGGSGGVRAARVAAGEHGAKVALAEEDRYGGTCVIRGCVPKKLMVFASGYSGVEAEAGAYGWDITLGDFNWDRFKGSMHTELDRLEAIYRRLIANSGVETFDARATVKDAHTVVLSTGEEKTAKHILVAVGGRPTRPNIPNADLGIVSGDLFDLPELPKKMLIIGGGYIASEFAGVMNGLGVSVTQYYRGDQILLRFLLHKSVNVGLPFCKLDDAPHRVGRRVGRNPRRVPRDRLERCARRRQQQQPHQQARAQHLWSAARRLQLGNGRSGQQRNVRHASASPSLARSLVCLFVRSFVRSFA